jgi:cytidyltransferase-like protein
VCSDAEPPWPELDAARRMASALGAPVHEFTDQELEGFPGFPLHPSDRSKRRVVVTGCFDWLHSGHVRFFEEVSAHGELYVVVGHDANVRLLKGEGHPRFPQEQRRYMTGAVRHVHRSLVSTGSGWMDAEPEIAAIGAHVYAVNEDGDKPEKREFCRAHGLEYLVLRRVPAAGLPRRTSTGLRGF